MSKQPPPAPTTSAVGPCPTVIQIVGRPGTGSLPSTIAPPDHPVQNNIYDHFDRYIFQRKLGQQALIVMFIKLISITAESKNKTSVYISDADTKISIVKCQAQVSGWTTYVTITR